MMTHHTECSSSAVRKKPGPHAEPAPHRDGQGEVGTELHGLSHGSVKVTSHGMAHFPACTGRGVRFYSCYHTAMVALL